MAEQSPQEVLEQQKAQCPFCKIVKGEIPSFKVFEDDKMLAITDINPAAKGHLLILPKEHYPILQLVPAETTTQMFEKLKYIVKGVKEGTPTDSVTIFMANGYVAGQQSPHFLFHVIPREKDDNLQQFAYKEVQLDDIKLQQVGAGLKSAIGKYLGVPTQKQVQIQTPPVVNKPDNKSESKESVEKKSEDKPPVSKQSESNFSDEQKKKLAEFIESNDDIKELLLSKPEELVKQIAIDSKLKEYFGNLDIKLLSERLNRGSK